MILTGIILLILLRIYTLLLIARIVIEMIQSFSRNFQPPRWFYFIAEPIFMLTDPPVKMLRRVIPSMRMGNVALDISVIVLFFILMILQMVVQGVFL
ncbi:YggT family protein [Corynebacterium halotolerans]|uniref:YggT family protein n=1 Tax=Corynebacterium halotolerans TaxID=225326 RepID=UPI003CEDFE69